MRLNRRILLLASATASAEYLCRASAGLSAHARSFYVSQSGADTNPGTIDAPFRSISRVFSAISDLGPNDTVIVMPGVYPEQVVVRKGGDASGYLTLKSQVPRMAKIRTPKNTYSAVNIISNYVVFDGFDVQGAGSGHGIEATFIDGNSKNSGPHHLKIINNLSHHNAGSGISLSYGDFYTVVGNTCHTNCATNRHQGSGISIYEARSVPGPSDGFRNIVSRNVCFDNMTIKLPGDPEPPHSDGNGIIIDDLINSQSHHPSDTYPFKTLVANNACFRNGGRGVHIFLSDNVVVLNNTAYHNNRDRLNPGTWRGELSNVGASNIIWANNIGVADPAILPRNTAINQASTRSLQSSDVVWRNNLTFNGRPGYASVDATNPMLKPGDANGNLLGMDPLFVGGDIKTEFDLRLRDGSPGIDAGTDAFGITQFDLSGRPRRQGRAVDLGAFEHAIEETTR